MAGPQDAAVAQDAAPSPEAAAPASRHALLQPGMEVDGYRLEEKIHVGGMATLWRVTDLQARWKNEDGSAPVLAMKVPRLFTIDDPTAIVAFEVEQMVMPRLKGRHVPRYFGAGDFDAQPYIVMEHIAGDSLRKRFDAAPLPIEEVVSVGIRVAQALHEVHRQHLIHLDLKPSNIMFRADGAAVLIDFGLARHDKLPDLLAEEFRLPLGTAPYISPEQVQGVRNEPRSDLFSLGVLMYHLLTGARPYGNPGSVSGLKKRLWRDPVPPRALRSEIPEWLQEVVLRCLDVDPENRFDTGAQLAFALQNPEQIPLTERAHKLRQDGFLTVLKRRIREAGGERYGRRSVSEQLSGAPILVAALDLTHGSTALADELRVITRRILESRKGARLACITVRKVSRIGLDEGLVQGGQNVHVKQLVELKHWAHTLEGQASKITFHVLEATDAATAIVDFANNNDADHIIIGSRGSSAIRRYLGSVSSQVVAEAECTVTVVKEK